MTGSQPRLWVSIKNSVGLIFLVAASHIVRAQDIPYFVTYDHHMEEAGTLEIETFATMGFPQSAEVGDPAERGQRFYAASYAEIEYSVLDRWTTGRRRTTPFDLCRNSNKSIVVSIAVTSLFPISHFCRNGREMKKNFCS